jgi:hypothetical protein
VRSTRWSPARDAQQLDHGGGDTILSLQNQLTPLQNSLNTLNQQISEKEAA